MTPITDRFSRRHILAQLGIGFAVAGTGVTPALAADEDEGAHNVDDAKTFVQTLADQALGVLTQADVSPEHRKQVFNDLLMERFNMPFLAAFALGVYGPRPGSEGSPGRTPTEEQFEEYKGLFNTFVLEKYSSMLGAYSGQRFKVSDARERGRRDFLVLSKVVNRDGSNVNVIWHVRDYDGELKIIDVRVENISMVVSQREEFGSIIRRGGFSGLLEQLRRHNDSRSQDPVQASTAG